MQVDVETYRVFLNALFDKLKSKEFSDPQKIPPKIKDVWGYKILNEGSKIAITQLRFNTTPMYFYKLKPPEKVTVGSIEVKNIALAKALAYIDDKESEKPFKQVKAWEEEARRLLEIFKEKQFGAEEDKFYVRLAQFKDRENFFLDVIAKENSLFHVPSLCEIINTFWQAISAKDYQVAWSMLSHRFQEKGIWKDDFGRFQQYFSSIQKVQNSVRVANATQFKFQTAKIGHSHTEEGYVYNIEKYIRDTQFASSSEWNIQDLQRTTNQKKFLSQLNATEYFHLHSEYKSSKYRLPFLTEITLKFVKWRWLIDSIDYNTKFEVIPELRKIKKRKK